MLPRGSFQGSDIKQNSINYVYSYFRSLFQDPLEEVRALTLPGQYGFTNPQSIENRFLRDYEEGSLFCLEKNKEVYSRISGTMPQDSDRVALIRADTYHYFGEQAKFPYNLIFLDWMNALDADKMFTIRQLLGNGYLSKRSILAVTINASGRCRGINASSLGIPREVEPEVSLQAHFLTTLTKSLMYSCGYRLSEKSYVIPYSCMDESSKAMPMLLGIFVSMGSRSLSAYNGW